MIYNYKKKNLSIARMLRRNMTKEEKHLWYDFLKTLPITVNRQKMIGNYIVDFFYSTMQGCNLRYTNEDVNRHFDAVCEEILRYISL